MNPIEWALCQSRFYRCQHRFKNVVFHRLLPKNNGGLSFFTGRSRRIVRCFFLGTLIAFQFVFFHGVISAAGKNLLAGGYQADIIFLHFNIDVNNIIFQDESLICVSEEKYHSYIQYVYS